MSSTPRIQPVNRRVTVIAVALAVTVHAGILAWASQQRDASHSARPPALEGLGATASVGGMPSTSRRITHELRVMDWEDGTSLEGVRVTDVFADNVVFSGRDGAAVLQSRPAARLVVRFEKPGFATVVRQLANTDTTASLTTIRLEHADVPYALVDTIFIQRCAYCHGAVGHVNGVDLTSYGQVMAGATAHGPLVRAHDPDSSRLVRVLMDSVGPDGKRSLHRLRTPRLDSFDLGIIVEWIREGARHVTPR